MAFNIGFYAYAYAIIGHTRADQLLPQLLMEQFDTLPIQCRHFEHMHEGVWFRKNNFWQNDSCENLDNFSLIRLLYMHRWCLLNLTVQCFSLNLTVRGVSNKYCLLTFFIHFNDWHPASDILSNKSLWAWIYFLNRTLLSEGLGVYTGSSVVSSLQSECVYFIFVGPKCVWFKEENESCHRV